MSNTRSAEGDENEHAGGRPRKHRLEDLLEYLAEHAASGRGEPLTASEVGEAMDWSRRSVGRRLDQLKGSRVVGTKKVGARARVWWVPTDVEVPTDPDELDLD